ncbi:hypothetical protein TNIN_421251 [Trichonephila inaurata madagascariensis]|uniref:Uncharacterized protein n=1 Tax=Trichonephila inaurata madagascariensis TaxID=2747483 RepID=A0A8X6YTP9_9ARAC|nr:hypothetical protein TNIN_421251 [Trichonephila inaurata madagascariensis]
MRYPFFTMSIATKCREIACGSTESSAPSCRTIDLPATSHRTERSVPDLWPTSTPPLRNLQTIDYCPLTCCARTHALVATNIEAGTHVESRFARRLSPLRP